MEAKACGDVNRSSDNYLSPDWFQVVTDLDGNFKMQIGSTGEEGFRDGNFDDAMFNRPQVTP